jgi:predicted dehydrogenase
VGSQCRLWGVPAFVKTELLPKLGEIHAIVMSRMVNTPEIALLGWRTDIKRNPLGQLMDHHIHNVDLLNWMFGAGKVIAAEMSIGKHVKWDFPDQYHAILAYHSSYGGKRALCSFIASEVSMADEWSLTVDGENGTLKVPAITFLQHVLERNPMTIRYEGGQEERFTPDLPTENPNLTQLRRFLHAIATGGPVDVTAKEAAAAVRIIEDIDRLAVRL